MALFDGDLPDVMKAELQDDLLDSIDDEVFRALILSRPSRPAPPRAAPRQETEVASASAA